MMHSRFPAHRRRLVAAAAVALVAIAAGPAVSAQLELSVFRGMVKDDGGQPVEGAVIKLVDQERGREFTTKSDKKGNFYRRGLPAASYAVEVSKEGYKPVEGDLRLNAGVDRNYSFELVKAAPEGSAEFLAGVAAYNKGDYAAAASAFESAAAKADIPDVRVNLALAYLRLKRTDEAIGELEKARAMAPDSPHVLFQLGSAYVDANKLDEASAAYEKGLSLQPDLQNAEAYDATVTLGAVYFARGQSDRAVATFQKALAAKPDAPAPMLGLAKAYFSQGNVDAARPLFEQIVTQHADSPEANEAKTFIAELDRLKGTARQ
jgi:tetratricopeptide (TPR) repeat protein